MGAAEWTWLAWSGVALGMLCCLVVLVQDLRGRWVHLLPLGGIALGGLLFHFTVVGTTTWMHLGINFGMLTILLSVVWGFFKWRGKAMKEMIGAGDIVLLYALAVWLDPAGFWLFYIVGMWMVLISVLIGRAAGLFRKDYPIPLAGLLAGAFMAWFWIWMVWGRDVEYLLRQMG